MQNTCLKKVFSDKLDKVNKWLQQCIERERKKNLMILNRIICTIQLENLYSVYFWSKVYCCY